MAQTTTIVYRGQYFREKSRVDFIVKTAAGVGPCRMVLLDPFGASDGTAKQSLELTHPSCDVIELPAAARQSRALRVRLQDFVGNGPLLAIGFTTPQALPGRRADVWFVNGIPDERLLSSRSVRSRAIVALRWRQALQVQRRLTVVVSEPMDALLQRRTPGPTLVVPNTVDTETFGVDGEEPSRRHFLTYLGGASPWQGLSRLAEVWAEVHRLDPTQQFRIISQDDRARRLADNLAASCVTFASTDDPGEVAALLGEATLGFLFRPPSLVNEVSAPMKLGEYLASGVGVVASRCGWDVERLIERTGAGLVVDWDAAPSTTARQILSHLQEPLRPAIARTAAAELSDSHWSQVLQAALDSSTTSDVDNAAGR